MWETISFLAAAGLVALHFFWRKQWRRAEEQVRRLERENEALRAGQARARTELNSQQEALLNSIPDGVLLLDREGRITTNNEALAQMFGVGRTLKGKTLLEVFRLHALVDLVREVTDSGQARELELSVPGLHQRFFEVNGSVLRQSEGQGVILTFHEMTRLKQLEKMRKEFVANVSHELRTPLTLIKGFAETLLDGANEEPEAARRFLGTIQRHADRLALIIDDLLTISHLESGQVVLDKQNLQIQPLVERVAGDLQSRAESRGVTIENRISPEVSVVADLQRVQQVLTNLLDNAVKYGRENGHVVLSARRCDDGMVQITVADDGPGIQEDALERVFERFYRVDKARSREQGGTGLGLSIVKHIVLSHGGRVWAESKSEKGSQFHFTLPAQSAKPQTEGGA